MFVVEQNRKIIFDMRHYGIYTMDTTLLAYPIKGGFALPLTLGEFDSQETCEHIANEIKTLIVQSRQIGEIFRYEVPQYIKKDGGEINEEE